MQTRTLGSTGLRVSTVGLGCNNFGGRMDAAAARPVVERALDLGITHFDTADIYGGSGKSEIVLGELLGTRRKDVVLATKFGMAMDKDGRLKGGSRRYVMAAAEDSLRRLRTDWIDLYYLHQPDPLTPVEETLRALDDLVRQGKVRYVACSNMPAWQIVDADRIARSVGLNRFAASQEEYNLLVRKPEAEVVPALASSGMGLIPYFPLAGGLLTGKYKRGASDAVGRLNNPAMKWLADQYLTDANWPVVDALQAFCTTRGKDLIDLAFAWLLARPLVASVIAGATSAAQIERNARAADWALSADDIAELDRITKRT